jgi:endoglucanase
MARNGHSAAGEVRGPTGSRGTARRRVARQLHIAACAGTCLALVLVARAAADARTAGAEQSANPVAGKRLYVNPASDARRQADQWQRSRSADAARMRKLAEQPTAIWFGEWNRDPRSAVDELLNRAGTAVPVVVIYNIPYRDCGLYSRGGAGDGNAYRRWTTELARGIRNRRIIVIIEPDAVAASECLPARLRDERYVLIRETANLLKRSGAVVYIDAGHSAWKSAREMSDRLRRSGISAADGFSLNVSNFQPNSALFRYGDQLSGLVGGKRYVLDTSRNGRGTAGREWCNPAGQAVGAFPSTNTGRPLVDAYLWVKVPGQSDGTCNGGPRAGQWWPEYALGLTRAAGL